ncbi:MAG: rhodanese-related sulfurtransferase [Ginsengibacter sp.]
MAILHNRISQRELKESLYKEIEPRTTFSFYHYTIIEDTTSFRNELYRSFNDLKVFGRIYIAHEGINAQLSVPVSNYGAVEAYLRTIDCFKNIRLNIAVDNDGKSFWVLKIKVRDKIVADGITDPDFDMSKKGKYLNAAEFNTLSSEPDTIVVDMRNHYEYEVGHFENAIEIPSDTFREQLPMAADLLQSEKDKNIIMYCTGGIRCEKASAYMLSKGFKNVFHLEGGIIHYANSVKQNNLANKFKGKNFVFDDRLGEKIGSEVISKCHQCGSVCDEHTNCANNGCHLLFIQCKNCADKYSGCCSEECKNIYNMPEGEQKTIRKGKMNGIMVFNKSRQRIRPVLKNN